jgi:hypothetical protein
LSDCDMGMTEHHQVPELVERDDGPPTGNAQRIAAEIAQALRDAGYSCAVLKVTPSPVVAPTDDCGDPAGREAAPPVMG